MDIEAALRANEERLRFVVEHTGQVIYDLDPATGEVNWSGAVAEVMGWAPAECAEWSFASWSAGLHPDDREFALEYAHRVVARPGPFGLEYRYRRKDGRTVYILDKGVSLADESGQVRRVLGSMTDVTARRLADQERRQLAQLIQNCPDFAGVASLDGRLTFLNQAGRELLGLAPTEPLETHCLQDWLLPAEAARLRDELLPTALATGSWRGEFRLRREGTPAGIPVDLTFFVMRHPATGEAESMAALCRDITARQQADAALRQTTERLGALVAALPAVVYTRPAHQAHCADYVSDNVEAVTGLSAARFLRQAELWLSQVHPDDRQALRDAWSRLATTGVEEVEYRWRVADGSFRWFHDALRLVAETDGQPAYIVGVMHNVDDLKQAEAALQTSHDSLERLVSQRTGELAQVAAELREAEGRLRALLDNVPDRAWLMDGQGRYLAANQALCRFAGRTPAEMVGRAPGEVFPAELATAFSANVRAVLESGEPLQREVATVDPNGAAAWAEANYSPILDDAGRVVGVAGIARDVTARIEADRALARARDAAEAASQAKSLFLAGMSHEIRTPLNVILGFAQLALRTEGVPRGVADKLQTIQRSGEHLLALVNDILEMSRIEAGRAVLAPKVFDLSALLAQLEAMFRHRTESQGLAFEVSYERELPPLEVADEGKVRQVLLNLLGNAAKFTSVGGIVVGGGTPPAPAQRLCVTIEVQDTGPGIAESEQELIFRPFEQTATGRLAGGGTGLGLAISRHHAHLLGGSLTVASQLGLGSRFIFEFLADLPDAGALAQPPAPTGAVYGLVPGHPTVRVLSIDDDLAHQQLVHELLTMVGIDVREVSSGEAGLAMLESWRPQAVLVDLAMPGIDGAETIRRLRAQPAGQAAKLLVVTAVGLRQEFQAAAAAGADGLLGKPFLPEELYGLLRTHLDLRFVVAEAPSGGPAAPEADLSRLPDELLSQLLRATHSGQLGRLRELLTAVRQADRRAADALGELVDAIDYDALTAALRREQTRRG